MYHWPTGVTSRFWCSFLDKFFMQLQSLQCFYYYKLIYLECIPRSVLTVLTHLWDFIFAAMYGKVFSGQHLSCLIVSEEWSNSHTNGTGRYIRPYIVFKSIYHVQPCIERIGFLDNVYLGNCRPYIVFAIINVFILITFEDVQVSFSLFLHILQPFWDMFFAIYGKVKFYGQCLSRQLLRLQCYNLLM